MSSVPKPAAAYPATRLRRPRAHAWSRALFAEATLTPADFIWPLFVTEGTGERTPFDRARLDALLDLAALGTDRLVAIQREVIAGNIEVYRDGA